MWDFMKYGLLALMWSFSLNQVSADIIADSGRGHHTCDKFNQNTGINAAQLLLVVNDMAVLTRNAMDDSQNWVANADELWDNYKLRSIFDAFFDGSNNDGQLHTRWNTVRNNLDIMANIHEIGPTNVYVLCDDEEPVFTVAANGDRIFHDPYTNTDVNLARSVTFCREVPPGGIVKGYRITWPNAGGRNYIVLCLNQNPDMLTVKTPKVNDYLPETTDLHNTFFHELSHVAIDTMRGQGIVLPNGVFRPGEQWGFEGCQRVRNSNPPYPLENPDSLMLFAHAWSLPGDLYWSKGFAFNRYDTWRLDCNAEVRQHFNLPEPPNPAAQQPPSR